MIILQTQNFWIQVLISFIGAFFGFGFALFFYILRKTKANKKQQKEFDEKNLKSIHYHQMLIDNIIKRLSDQQKRIQEYINNQSKNLLDLKVPRQILTEDFHRLKNINKEIFNALNHNHKDDKCKNWVEDLKDLHKNLDYAEGSLKEINRLTDEYLKYSYQNLVEVKNGIQKIPDKLTVLALRLEYSLGDSRHENQFYVFVDSKIKRLYELIKVSSDFDFLNENYLEPLLNGIMKSELKFDPIIQEVILLAKNARIKATDIKKDVGETLNEFEKIKKSINETQEKISEINTRLFSMNQG